MLIYTALVDAVRGEGGAGNIIEQLQTGAVASASKRDEYLRLIDGEAQALKTQRRFVRIVVDVSDPRGRKAALHISARLHHNICTAEVQPPGVRRGDGDGGGQEAPPGPEAEPGPPDERRGGLHPNLNGPGHNDPVRDRFGAELPVPLGLPVEGPEQCQCLVAVTDYGSTAESPQPMWVSVCRGLTRRLRAVITDPRRDEGFPGSASASLAKSLFHVALNAPHDPAEVNLPPLLIANDRRRQLENREGDDAEQRNDASDALNPRPDHGGDVGNPRPAPERANGSSWFERELKSAFAKFCRLLMRA